MKNLVKTFVVLFLFISQFGSAQVSGDILFGITSNDAIAQGLDQRILPNIQSKVYPSLSANVNYSIDKHFFVSSGLEITKIGFDMLESTSFDLFGFAIPVGAKVSYTERTFNIPLHLGFELPTSFGSIYAKGGVSYAIGAGGSYRLIADSIIDYVLVNDPIPYGDRVNRAAISSSFGLGLAANYGTGQLKIETIYQHGLTNKLQQENLNLSLRTKSIGVRAGYSMRF